MKQKAGVGRRSSEGCPVGDVFHLLGRSYVLDILYVFVKQVQGPVRFVDLQNRLDLSPNTLSDRLKALVEAGLLTRTAYSEIPPRVDYEATDKAYSLCPVFDALDKWSTKNDLKPVPAGR